MMSYVYKFLWHFVFLNFLFCIKYMFIYVNLCIFYYVVYIYMIYNQLDCEPLESKVSILYYPLLGRRDAS